MPTSRQPELIKPEHLVPRLRWEQLFAFLPPWPEEASGRGRRPVSRDALLRACIYQRLGRRRFLTDLRDHLAESPPMMAAVGFNPYQGPPPVERFSSFLDNTASEPFRVVFMMLVRDLLDAGVITGTHVGFDSCAVPSWVRENNLKVGLRHSRFDKKVPPRADPDARLGVRIHYPSPGRRQVDYFWGYRHHALVDLQTELPVWTFTEPCNVDEQVLAIPLLEAPAVSFGLHYQSVCGDAEYDAERILRYIQEHLKAKAYVPRNPKYIPNQEGFVRKKDRVICPADLEMPRHGKMTVKGITYIQYRCPFYYPKRRPDVLMCPASHPKFSKQQGCNYLWRITDNPRDRIPYGTREFKLHYKRRTAVERVFSRLRALTLQEPSVRGLQSIRNHCLITDIAMLLVALAAYRLGYEDKIGYVRTLVPHVLD